MSSPRTNYTSGGTVPLGSQYGFCTQPLLRLKFPVKKTLAYTLAPLGVNRSTGLSRRPILLGGLETERVTGWSAAHVKAPR